MRSCVHIQITLKWSWRHRKVSISVNKDFEYSAKGLNVNSFLWLVFSSRTPKSISNGLNLYTRNKKNTFKDVDTRFVPQVDQRSFLSTLISKYCSPFIQESWSILIHAQVYMNVCVYCAVFPNLPLLPASVGSERDFWEPGMGCMVKNPWPDAWWKDQSLFQSLLFPWCPYWNSTLVTIIIELRWK